MILAQAERVLSLTESTPSPGNSRPVRSNQTGPHARLAETVRRHLAEPWRAPLHGPSERVFEALEARRRALGAQRPVVLDAGCGTGESTRRLAARHAEAVVIGVDRSATRLARVGAEAGVTGEERVLWARADLATLWRLAVLERWPVAHHYLLYPNPWPKSAHLGRRWHGHPVFPHLLALGGRLELRTNWATYAEEFAAAVALATGAAGRDPAGAAERLPAPAEPLSPFERKYAASGHALWRVRTALTGLELPTTAI